MGGAFLFLNDALNQKWTREKSGSFSKAGFYFYSAVRLTAVFIL